MGNGCRGHSSLILHTFAFENQQVLLQPGRWSTQLCLVSLDERFSSVHIQLYTHQEPFIISVFSIAFFIDRIVWKPSSPSGTQLSIIILPFFSAATWIYWHIFWFSFQLFIYKLQIANPNLIDFLINGSISLLVTELFLRHHFSSSWKDISTWKCRSVLMANI